MSIFRYNRILLSHLISSNQTRLIIPTNPSSIIVRHATEIRSRKPIKNDSNPKQRKNTVNPIAQVKKLGDKAGRMDFNKFLIINLNGIHLYIFSQDTFK
jgi:hypothetical protein